MKEMRERVASLSERLAGEAMRHDLDSAKHILIASEPEGRYIVADHDEARTILAAIGQADIVDEMAAESCQPGSLPAVFIFEGCSIRTRIDLTVSAEGGEA